MAIIWIGVMLIILRSFILMYVYLSHLPLDQIWFDTFYTYEMCDCQKAHDALQDIHTQSIDSYNIELKDTGYILE